MVTNERFVTKKKQNKILQTNEVINDRKYYLPRDNYYVFQCFQFFIDVINVRKRLLLLANKRIYKRLLIVQRLFKNNKRS